MDGTTFATERVIIASLVRKYYKFSKISQTALYIL